MFFNPHENYGYLNALLRSRLGFFFKKEAYEGLYRRGLEGLVTSLLEGKYGRGFRSELVSRKPGLLKRIETAIAAGVGFELLRMRKVAEGETKDLVTVLLARGDLRNIRVLLRSFLPESDRSYGEPLWHIYGTISPQSFSLLWSAESLQILVERSHDIRNPLGNILGKAAMELLKGKPFYKVERACLGDFQSHLFSLTAPYSSSNGALMEQYLRMSVDILNFGIWLRKQHSFEYGNLENLEYLPQGMVSLESLNRSRSILEVARGTPWYFMIRQIHESRPNMFQQALAGAFLRWQASFLRKNPLGIEISLAYTARQLAEWDNLNYIVTGLALGYREEKIMERLLLIL